MIAVENGFADDLISMKWIETHLKSFVDGLWQQMTSFRRI